MPGPPLVMRDDEVIDLHDARGDDDQRGDEYGPHHRDNDEEIGLPRGIPSTRDAFQISSSMPRRPASIRHMTSPVPCHSAAMTMRIDDDIGIVERVKSKFVQAQVCEPPCTPKAGLRIHCQTKAGDDEGQRERVEEDRAERVLEADFLIHEARPA